MRLDLESKTQIVSLDEVQPLLFSVCLQTIVLALCANGIGYLWGGLTRQMNTMSIVV